MRVVLVGASGNTGTSLLDRLASEPRVRSVLGIARRRPRLELEKVTWAEADIAGDDLTQHFRGADCVVHLAWLLQPSRDTSLLWRANVAALRGGAGAGVPSLVYASSTGVYSPGPKHARVDESWPRDGIPSLYYSREKAEIERRLDRFEQDAPGARVVRLRPAFIFKREAASGQRRLFAGPFLPTSMLRSSFLPLLPDVLGLRFQAVHSHDIAEAYRIAVVSDVRGAFNIAAEPVLDTKLLAREAGARTVPLPGGILRAATAAARRARIVPVDEGWIDAGLQSPLLDVTRAERELGWRPRYTAVEAIKELVAGMREGAGAPTPPLEPGRKVAEITTRVGGTDRRP